MVCSNPYDNMQRELDERLQGFLAGSPSRLASSAVGVTVIAEMLMRRAADLVGAQVDPPAARKLLEGMLERAINGRRNQQASRPLHPADEGDARDQTGNPGQPA